MADAGPGRGRRPTGGPSFEDILAGMGLDGDGGDGPTARRQRTASDRAATAAEAVAEIDLDEAFHGTTRLIELDGKRLEVTIPPGADTGTRIRLTGKAPGGGDMHVVVRQQPDPVFTRKGADLERELPITLGEALLGAEVPVALAQGPRPADHPAPAPRPAGCSASAAAACRASRATATATSSSAPGSSCRPTCPTRPATPPAASSTSSNQPDPRTAET